MEKILSRSKTERIAYLEEDFWLDLDKQSVILKEMEELYQQPRRQRPRCMLLIADSGMGKTAMMNEFNRRHHSYVDEITGVLMQPVVALELPVPVDISSLLTAILKASGCPVRSGKRLEDLFDYFLRQMGRIGLKTLVIDEIQRLSLISSRIVIWQVCECLKRISTSLQIPVIVTGTYAARQYFSQDDQLARRFKVREMPNWELSKNFQTLVKSILSYMPLRQGFDAQICTDPRILEALLKVSETTTDGLLEHIRRLTIISLRGGREYLASSDFIQEITE